MPEPASGNFASSIETAIAVRAVLTLPSSTAANA